MALRNADKWVLATLGFVALVASVGFYSFPLTDIPIGTDSAVFTYIGRVMSAGGAPYVDVFDHKGPLVYLLNAIGTLGPSTWVLWLVEWLFLTASLCLAYRMGLAMGVPRLASVAVPVLFVPYIVYRAEGGNLTEEYCLPFMFATVLMAVQSLKGAPIRRSHALLMGAFAACVFMLKFTALIGLFPFYAAIVAVACAKRGVSCALLRVGWFAGGFAAVFCAFGSWLGAVGALEGFFRQYIAFNVVYANAVDAGARWAAAGFFAGDLALLLSVAATIVAVGLCMLHRGAQCGRETAIAMTGFVGIASLFALVVVLGRSYGHYLLMFVPLYVVVLNAAVFQVRRAVGNHAAFAAAAAAVGLALVYFPAAYGACEQLAYRAGFVETRAAVVAKLQDVAGRGDIVAVGNECWVYLDGGFWASAPYAYRSDAMPEAYGAWLSGLIASDSAPSAIIVADYVELDLTLDSYREVAVLEGFTIYGRV
ncbi:MAG: hypothetical protein IJ087_06175 [Eggerthellaceae bacterium]|nr:hypothetical protein [Eggerthellaceae bacterium]